MKKISHISLSICLVVLLGILSSCGKDVLEERNTDKRVLTFNVVNYEQISLDDITRASGSVLPHLTMAIYDENDKLVSSVTQESTSNTFGQFSVELEAGNYSVLFVGYDKDNAINVDNVSVVSFANSEVPHVLYSYQNITVGKNTEGTNEVILQRCVSRFELRINDRLPQNIGNFSISTSNVGVAFNAKTGLASQSTTYTKTFNLTSLAGSTEPLQMGVYCFLPEESANVSVTATAYASNGEEIKKSSFTDVPLKVNQLTRYKGDFFAELPIESSFSLTFPSTLEWVNVKELDY